MGLQLLQGPTEEPVSLGEAKAQCRVDHNDEDALITSFIVAARQLAESRTRMAIISQNWRLSLDSFPVAGIILPRPPLLQITKVSYLDQAGVSQDLVAGQYRVQTSVQNATVRPPYGQCLPSARQDVDSVRVEFTAGYANAAAVPAAIKQWMLLCIGTWYANRESTTAGKLEELPRAHWDALLDPYIVWGYE